MEPLWPVRQAIPDRYIDRYIWQAQKASHFWQVLWATKINILLSIDYNYFYKDLQVEDIHAIW